MKSNAISLSQKEIICDLETPTSGRATHRCAASGPLPCFTPWGDAANGVLLICLSAQTHWRKVGCACLVVENDLQQCRRFQRERPPPNHFLIVHMYRRGWWREWTCRDLSAMVTLSCYIKMSCYCPQMHHCVAHLIWCMSENVLKRWSRKKAGFSVCEKEKKLLADTRGKAAVVGFKMCPSFRSLFLSLWASSGYSTCLFLHVFRDGTFM